MKQHRLAVIGAHRRGKISLLAHQPERGFRLVHACSLDDSCMDEYRQVCGDEIHYTSDYHEILVDRSINAVFICTPDFLHEEQAVAFLRAGKSVYLEKPMAITIDGCDRILEAAREGKGLLYVGHNMRFFPVFQKMKELIDSGRIGRVQAIWCRHFISYGGDAYFKDWHSERRNTTGLLLQKGAHDIDVIHWLAGAPTHRVVGMGKLSVYNEVSKRSAPGEVSEIHFKRENWPPLAQTGLSPVIDVEDHSMILMQLSNGIQASYMQCHYTPDDQRNYTVIGTEGRIENYGDHATADKWPTIHLWNQRTGYNEMGHEVFRIAHIDGTHGGSDPQVINDYLNLLEGKQIQGANPSDARMSVAVGCLGTKSLRCGSIPFEVPAQIIRGTANGGDAETTSNNNA